MKIFALMFLGGLAATTGVLLHVDGLGVAAVASGAWMVTLGVALVRDLKGIS